MASITVNGVTYAENPWNNNLEFIQRAFEPWEERRERYRTGEIYNEKYIERCREYALQADKYDVSLRCPCLQDLKKCVPIHRFGYVFNGIRSFD